MSWAVSLMKAPEDAVTLDDVPEGYGHLGTVAQVVERLRGIIPEACFQSDTAPGAWFENYEDRTEGGVECDAYSLRMYLQTLEDEAEPGMPSTGMPTMAKDTIMCVFLAFKPAGDPHKDMNHPVWDFIAAACRALECRAEDDGRFLGPDGRPIPLPEPKWPWWQFWR
jgi:hypothetical protein